MINGFSSVLASGVGRRWVRGGVVHVQRSPVTGHRSPTGLRLFKKKTGELWRPLYRRLVQRFTAAPVQVTQCVTPFST